MAGDIRLCGLGRPESRAAGSHIDTGCERPIHDRRSGPYSLRQYDPKQRLSILLG
jgi:hypothetical protein